MALIDDFKAMFPEFNEATVDQFFPSLEAQYPCYYGGSVKVACEKNAILYLMAHLLLLKQRQTESPKGGKPLRSASNKSVGSVSVSYESDADNSRQSQFFKTTSYGQTFLMLISNSYGAKFV